MQHFCLTVVPRVDIAQGAERFCKQIPCTILTRMMRRGDTASAAPEDAVVYLVGLQYFANITEYSG